MCPVCPNTEEKEEKRCQICATLQSVRYPTRTSYRKLSSMIGHKWRTPGGRAAAWKPIGHWTMIGASGGIVTPPSTTSHCQKPLVEALFGEHRTPQTVVAGHHPCFTVTAVTDLAAMSCRDASSGAILSWLS